MRHPIIGIHTAAAGIGLAAGMLVGLADKLVGLAAGMLVAGKPVPVADILAAPVLAAVALVLAADTPELGILVELAVDMLAEPEQADTLAEPAPELADMSVLAVCTPPASCREELSFAVGRQDASSLDVPWLGQHRAEAQHCPPAVC